MAESVFARLCQVLDDAEVRYEVTRHEAVYTSEEAAAVRGAQLASGAKALVCKANGEFLMFVVPADRRLDSKRLRKQHGMRGLRFANFGRSVCSKTQCYCRVRNILNIETFDPRAASGCRGQRDKMHFWTYI